MRRGTRGPESGGGRVQCVDRAGVRSGARHGSLSEELLFSVVTAADLEVGVLTATDIAIRSQRLRTVESAPVLRLVAVDSRFAITWACLRAILDESARRMRVNDLWIASFTTALARQVVAQDDVLAERGHLEVVKDSANRRPVSG